MNIGTIYRILVDSRRLEMTDIELTGYDEEFRTFVVSKSSIDNAKVYFLKSPDRIRVPYDSLVVWLGLDYRTEELVQLAEGLLSFV